MKLACDRSVAATYIHLDPSETKKAEGTYACDPDKVGGQNQLDFDDSGRLMASKSSM